MEPYWNTSNATHTSTQAYGTHVKIVSYSILLVWSLIGNILVIAVVYWNTHLRTSFNFVIVNMAISDLFVPLITLPLNIVQKARQRPHEWLVSGPVGEVLCKLCYFLADITPAVSVFSLIIIAFNRFFAVVYPVRGLDLNSKRDKVFICLTWVISSALFSPYFYTFRLAPPGEGEDQPHPKCVHDWSPAFDNTSARGIFTAIVIITAFIIPLIVITTLYSIMVYKIFKASKETAQMMHRRQSRYRQRRNRQIFYISMAIVAGFVISWGPFFSYLFVIQFIWKWDIPIPLEKHNLIVFVVQFMGYSNAAINPAIYFLFLQNYRQGLKRLFKGRRQRKMSSQSSIPLQNGRFSSRLTLLADLGEYFSKKRRSRTSSV